MRNICLSCFLLFCFTLQAQLPAFDAAAQPAAPDYALEKFWSCLPFHKDEADNIPSWETWVDDSLKQVDVFYIYPTIYMKGKTWNEDLSDKALNKRIDSKPVRYQASVFNASCRVYVPRYRQAIIDVFYDTTDNGKKALAFAYDDVKRAFEYFLEHYSKGRPFIIASHSQGTYHSRRLLKEVIDTNPELRKRLVAAYAIGYALNDTMFQYLKPCDNADQTGCYITWASYKNNYEPGPKNLLAGNICINPVMWNRDTAITEAYKSKGTLLLSFKKKYDKACRVQIHNNILWVDNNLPIVGSMNNLHIADYNLFWFDIRENVANRIKQYLKQ